MMPKETAVTRRTGSMTLCRVLRTCVVAVTIGLAALPGTAQEAAFDTSVAPLLVERCTECHGGLKPKGNLDLTRKAATAKVVSAANLSASLLWQRVEAGEMPPKKPLADNEKAILKAWIESGAVWGSDPIDPFRVTTSRRAGYDWWSLQPVKRPNLPAVKRTDWPYNPIDRFVIARLESEGLAPSLEADARTLIRRLYVDLVGLPPLPEDVDAFIRIRTSAPYDPQDAYLHLVDRLLASPRHGERWARHWLDIVRFGESHGFEHDELRKNAWPYRDWVIDAFNKNMPYDAFARLQLAGDVLALDNPDAITPTGFLVAGGYDSVGQGQQSTAMKKVVRQDELEDIVGTIGQTFLGLTIQCARCHDHKFDPVRTEEYYRLTAAVAGVRHGERQIKPALRAYAVTPRAPERISLLIRGNPAQPGPVVRPGGVAALKLAADFQLAADASDAERRRKLADWITDTKNPLFARVMVNRLWHHHFGIGLVDTPSDFGFNGGRPSHLALLDWLADEFVRSGYDIKHMHRLIVTSATYRQASRYRADTATRDADNRWLWRKTPRRMEAETLRDSILAVAGQLNLQQGGPGYQDFTITIRGATYYYTPTDADDPGLYRRSIYRTWARSGRNRFLDAHDCPDPSTVAPRRALTTTPLQALALMNGSLVLRMADRFGERLQREAGNDVGKQIARAYALAYGRPATADEIARLRPIVERHGLTVFCRAIFNSNEFVYVD
jgi:hypothetical protein